jgi:plastocyanin
VAPLCAATIQGRVTVLEKRGKSGDPGNAIVWLDGIPADTATARSFDVDTKNKTFATGVLAVPVGSTVRFPNSDEVRHNVFSVSKGNAFDLGLYGKGESKDATFREPGIVRVYCNVHPQMAMVVVVSPTSHFARVRKDGTFEIQNAPAGTYRVKAWDPRGGEAEEEITVEAQDFTAVSFTLDASKFKAKPHMNKEGNPYPTDEKDYLD